MGEQDIKGLFNISPVRSADELAERCAVNAAWLEGEGRLAVFTFSETWEWATEQACEFCPTDFVESQWGQKPQSDEGVIRKLKQLEAFLKTGVMPSGASQDGQPNAALLAEPLTQRAEAVYREIIRHKVLTGPQITKLTGVDQSTLTKEIVPELKRLRGIVNKRGAGYYSPSLYTPQ